MVRYIILCKFLQEILPLISFRSARLLAWIYAKGEHLQNFQTTAPATWCNSTENYPADTTLPFDPDNITASSEDLSVGQESEMGDYSGDEFNPDQNLAPCSPCDKPHDAGHIDPVPPRLSDTCPHSCVILNQNVNRLGKKSYDKLEKLIKLMIEQKINGYCAQETWQLESYIKTIRGHTVLHHGMNV